MSAENCVYCHATTDVVMQKHSGTGIAAMACRDVPACRRRASHQMHMMESFARGYLGLPYRPEGCSHTPLCKDERTHQGKMLTEGVVEAS